MNNPPTPLSLSDHLATDWHQSMMSTLCSRTPHPVNKRSSRPPETCHSTITVDNTSNICQSSQIKAVKHLLCYLQGMCHQTIVYQGLTKVRDDTLVPVSYLDTDWATNHSNHKSISAYIFPLAGRPITWVSKKQKSIVTSLCKAKLYALSLAAMQALYI